MEKQFKKYFNEEYDKGLVEHPLEAEHLSSSDFLMTLIKQSKNKTPIADASNGDVYIESEEIIQILRLLNLLCIEYFSYAFADSIPSYDKKIFFNAWLQQLYYALFKEEITLFPNQLNNK